MDAIPEAPGVYLFYGDGGAPLYVGKSRKMRSRGLQHFSASLRSSLDLYGALGVPADRLLLGLPLYGVDWPVAGPVIGGPSTGRGEAWFPRAHVDLLADPSVVPERDEVALGVGPDDVPVGIEHHVEVRRLLAVRSRRVDGRVGTIVTVVAERGSNEREIRKCCEVEVRQWPHLGVARCSVTVAP